jgi:putative (di)nucleoside polyphosphate hydrolase
MTDLPYRLNVGAALFNRHGQVFIGRRADIPDRIANVWQMPQGGIDPGEDPRTAIFRELAEEIGTDRAEILAEHPAWLDYDLPPDLVGTLFGGRYRGQRQRWFALRFLGDESDIRLDAHTHPEFVAWRWADLAELPLLCVPFKRATYETVARDFAKFAVPVAG